MKAIKGHQVVVNFNVRTNEGALVSDGPQTLTLGNGDAFLAIEEAIVGMSEGEVKTLALTSDHTFGPRRDELLLRIPLNQLPAGVTPSKGMELTGKNDKGQSIRLVITEVGEDTVIADGNHPLAGVDLNFELKVIKITGAN